MPTQLLVQSLNFLLQIGDFVPFRHVILNSLGSCLIHVFLEKVDAVSAIERGVQPSKLKVFGKLRFKVLYRFVELLDLNFLAVYLNFGLSLDLIYFLFL